MKNLCCPNINFESHILKEVLNCFFLCVVQRSFQFLSFLTFQFWSRRQLGAPCCPASSPQLSLGHKISTHHHFGARRPIFFGQPPPPLGVWSFFIDSTCSSPPQLAPPPPVPSPPPPPSLPPLRAREGTWSLLEFSIVWNVNILWSSTYPTRPPREKQNDHDKVYTLPMVIYHCHFLFVWGKFCALQNIVRQCQWSISHF